MKKISTPCIKNLGNKWILHEYGKSLKIVILLQGNGLKFVINQFVNREYLLKFCL